MGWSMFCLSSACAIWLLNCVTVCISMFVHNMTTDQAALLAFKSQITSDPYDFLSRNWSTRSSVCNWIGVSCGMLHQRIRTLNLSGFGLQGTIAPHIGNLTFLRSLDISYNNFSGFIPDQLVHLHQLKLINVGFNSVIGEIPPWLGSLPELQHLLLHNNNFTSSIPSSFGNISKLETLNMRDNFLHGYIPSEIGNLSRLVLVELRNNYLIGGIPPRLFNISSLEVIDLTNNSMFGSLPVDMCGHLTELSELYLAYNQFSGQIPSNLYRCRNLQLLYLYYNQFNGSIPKEIGRLTMLQDMGIGGNIFKGGIPLERGNLTQLQVLSLQTGLLSGKLPSFLFNMPSLRVLDLGNNSLSGSLTMEVNCSLPFLEMLYLGSNNLTGQIPSSIWECRRLQIINLGYNKLTGGISRKVGNLTLLKILNLFGNRLTGELPAEVGNLNLEHLILGDNGLSGPIPFNIFNISALKLLGLDKNNFSGHLPSTLDIRLPNLEEIGLSSNKLSGHIPNFVFNASKLSVLVLTSNSFHGPIPTSLGNLRMLRRLMLGENNLTREASTPELRFVSALTNCKYLEMVELSLNQLNGILPPSIGNLSSSLHSFNAFGSKIKGAIPREIGNLSNLQGIFLDNNQLTGHIPKTLGNLESAEAIYLEHNKLEGQIPPDLCKLTKLGDIYISDNMLNGSIPVCLGEMKSLRRVYLDSNRLTPSIPYNFWSLTDLTGLNLSSNHLSGSLPAEIKNLKVIRELGLSLNQFSGEIPSSISGAQSIVYLSLAHNRFGGAIPESLQNLINLEYLDLSSNNLSGIIPKSLEKLRYLKVFNVSFNNLDGEIPTGGPFSNFTGRSFLHNDALCGVPRLQVPSCKKITLGSRWKSVSSLMKYIIPPLVFAILLLIVFLLIRNQKLSVKPLHSPFSPLSTLKEVSYQELVQATDAFSETNLLGTGGFGMVYRGTLSGSLNVAVKVFHSQFEEGNKSFVAECEILRNVRHGNLVRIITCCSNLDFKALVLEYMPNGILEKWLHSHHYFLDLLQRLDIALHVSLALEYLHHSHPTPIVHCDMKPSNILPDEDMVARVSDFGIAKLLDEGQSTIQTKTLATVGYMAPEYGAEGIVSTSVDVYSFGVILLEMFTRKKPTDEMFGEAMNLKSWVSNSLHDDSILNVVDTNLFGEEDENFPAKKQTILSVFHLAMDCLSNTPQGRISSIDIAVRLQKIKSYFRQIFRPQR